MLEGAYDIHVHAYPSRIPRKYSILELTKLVSEHKMRGILFYDHSYNTQPLVQLINAMGFYTKVFGSIMLNNACGGVSAEVVDNALKLGTKLISFPTYDARSHVERMGHDVLRFPDSYAKKTIHVLDERSCLIPEVREIISMVKHEGAVLASGHLSFAEDIAIAREAKRVNLKAFIVNSVSSDSLRLTIKEQKELAREGAFLEHDYMAISSYVTQKTPVEEIVEAIKTVGAERCLIATDSGQATNPDEVTALTEFMQVLLKYGIKESEMELMIKANPKYILE